MTLASRSHKLWFRVTLYAAPGVKMGDMECTVEALEETEAVYKAFRLVRDKAMWTLGAVKEIKPKKKKVMKK